MTEMVAPPLSAGAEPTASMPRQLVLKAVVGLGLAVQVAWLAGACVGLYALADVIARAVTGYSF